MRWPVAALFAVVLSGCHAFYVDMDGQIARRAEAPIDELPARPNVSLLAPVTDDPGLVQVAIQKDKALPDDKENKMLKRLEFKESVLGLKISDIKMPTGKVSDKEYDEAMKRQFPALPALPSLPQALPGPDGRPLTLADLQQIALRTNPKIRQAHLDVEAARGIAVQAGLYPNPNLGFNGASIGQGDPGGQRSPGQPGGFVEQTLVTMGKRTIARHAAERDVQIAQQNLRRVESEVQTQVRVGYFAFLSARENHRITKGLTELTDELYAVLLQQMRVGEVAAYEPMQIRVVAMQARGTLAVAQNRYLSAWRQLAAALGMPQMPLTALEGRIDMPVPHYEHDQVLAYVLANHSEVMAAELGVDRHRLLVRLAEAQPYPDVSVGAVFQKDFTTAPFGTIAGVTVGVPFPIFDRNQGNIQAARALLRKATEDNQRVRNDLTARTAEAFERYDNNRKLLELYRKDILPNQVQAFRAALARHAGAGGISYNDLITSQQTLGALIGSYLGALNDQWTSVTDIGNLLQTRDLFQIQPFDDVAPIPDVHEIYGGRLRHLRHR